MAVCRPPSARQSLRGAEDRGPSLLAWLGGDRNMNAGVVHADDLALHHHRVRHVDQVGEHAGQAAAQTRSCRCPAARTAASRGPSSAPARTARSGSSSMARSSTLSRTCSSVTTSLVIFCRFTRSLNVLQRHRRRTRVLRALQRIGRPAPPFFGQPVVHVARCCPAARRARRAACVGRYAAPVDHNVDGSLMASANCRPDSSRHV